MNPEIWELNEEIKKLKRERARLAKQLEDIYWTITGMAEDARAYANHELKPTTKEMVFLAKEMDGLETEVVKMVKKLGR